MEPKMTDWISVKDRLPSISPKLDLCLDNSGDVYHSSRKVILCLYDELVHAKYLATGRARWINDEFRDWIIDIWGGTRGIAVTHWAYVELPELDGDEDD
jgi:hypothetical protein